ncbi:hypothetical protein O6H91_Y368100 [Diphasiastrum complanatum]|nr:hypothetical protein O6H91_Y368100 [Diphasiastrum complanatum]
MKIYVSALRRPPSLLHPPHNGMDRISAKRLSSSSSVYAKFKCFSFSNPFIMPSLELQNGTILFLHKPTNTAATPQALRIRLCTILHLIGVNSLGLRVNPSSVRAVKQSDSSNSIADDEEFEFREAEEVGSAEDGDKFDDFEKVSEGNVDVMVEKIGSNKRRVTAHVCIEAPLDTVWQVLTDYEGLADFIPNLVACQLLERREHGARLLQVLEHANRHWGIETQSRSHQIRQGRIKQIKNLLNWRTKSCTWIEVPGKRSFGCARESCTNFT